MRHGALLGWRHFRNVLRLWGLSVEKRYEDANLHHIQEFSVEGLLHHHLQIIELLEDFALMLSDQEAHGKCILRLIFRLVLRGRGKTRGVFV